jgi:hypothetical protein
MNRRCPLLAILVSLLLLFGCVKPVLTIPDPPPPIVKTYRSVKLFAGNASMLNTGVHLEEGDVYSIFATGEMDYCPKGGCGYRKVSPESGWSLVTRVGDGMYTSPYSHGGGSRNYAGETGDLFVGYRSGPLNLDGTPKHPRYYRDDLGSFTIDIIVWSREDYGAIVAFLEDLSRRDPENKSLTRGLLFVKHVANIYEKVQEASEEIKATRKEIASLKAEAGEVGGKPGTAERPSVERPGPSPGAYSGEKASPPAAPLGPAGNAEKHERIAALEARLAQLQEALVEFEKMKRALAEERQKTEKLTRELGELERRERDLTVRLEEGGKVPPVVVIASPEDGGIVEVNVIALRGVVEDEEGIARIEISINGEPLTREGERGLEITRRAGGRRHAFLERVPLEEGENRIRVKAEDVDGLAAEKTVTLQCVRQRKRIWAVVVGINEYANVPPLRFAVNDARAFYGHLVHHMGIPEENVTLLLDREADLTTLRSVLGTRLKNRAGEDDMVILFFAGHGATERDVMSPDGDGLEKYLLPCGADLEDLYASALPMREIQHVFNRIRSERLVFVVDSCYSGASGGRTVSLAGLRANISEGFMERIASGRGRVILSASGANEVSEEDEALGHGVFTYHLLEGLKGPADADRDGLITVDEAYGYVSRRVPDATGQEQHPVKKGAVEGRLIIGVVP